MNDLFGSVVVDRSGAEHITVKQARLNLTCEEYIQSEASGDDWSEVSRKAVRCFVFPSADVLQALVVNKYRNKGDSHAS